MAESKLRFSTSTTRRIPIRTAPSKFLTSKLRGTFEISDGIRPAEAFLPYKYLPALFQDTETDDWVVIPKGRIVSALTNQNASGAASSGTMPGASGGGWFDPLSSGTMYIFDDATTTASSFVTIDVNDEYWGIVPGVVGMLVPANGGIAAAYIYTTNDVSVGTINPADGFTADEGDTITVPANHPIGVVTGDVYQDIRGYNLNYDMWDLWGILCDWYVEVPYADATFGAAGFATAYGNGTLPTTADLGYWEVNKRHSFFYFDSSLDSDLPIALAGTLIGPDMYGHYIPLRHVTAQDTTVYDFEEPMTAQCVGRLMVTDSRYPKDMLDMVDNYPGSGVDGTETGGIPENLYTFTHDALKAMGSGHTIQDVVDGIQAGTYGMARIQLNI